MYQGKCTLGIYTHKYNRKTNDGKLPNINQVRLV